MSHRDFSESIIGSTLDGKYRIERLIGRGGMGAVYKAEHVGTGRPVAVKSILPNLVRDLDHVERFRREARAAGSLRHPNIVDVTDFGVAELDQGNVAYLVMEYLEGSTLRALIEHAGTLPVDIVVDVVEQVALALEAAHRIGIIHRDLKPDNIWLVPDPRGGYVVRILDFGVAKLRETGEREPSRIDASTIPDSPAIAGSDNVTEIRGDAADPDARLTPPTDTTEPAVEPAIRAPEDTPTIRTPARALDLLTLADSASPQLTAAGTTLGTPAYMSPEQCRGEPVDARSDVYSLGIVTFQALTGQLPFKGTYFDLVRQHSEIPAPLASEVNPDVPPRVSDAVHVALAKAPHERYQSAAAMAGSLRVAAEGPSVVIRKAATLYLDRFGTFLSFSVQAAGPALVLLVIAAVITTLLFQAPVNALALFLFLWVVGSSLWGVETVVTDAVFSIVVERLRAEPLSPVDAEAVFRALRARVGLSEDAGSWSTLIRLFVFQSAVKLKAPAGMTDLAFQIAFHEGLDPREAADRCKLLGNATTRSYSWLHVSAILAQLFIPLVEACVLLTVAQFTVVLIYHIPLSDVFLPVFAIVAISMPLIGILVNPMLSPSFAILYFRARQARGEEVGISALIPSRL